MKKPFAIISSLIALIYGIQAHADKPALVRAPSAAPASIVKLHGIPTFQVDGRPFFILGAQCDIWRSTHQDAQTLAFFDGFRDMNATTVSVGIPWSKTEPKRDEYDFTFLDWFIKQAQSRGLKLIVNLFNSDVCGKVQEGVGDSVYPQYAPDYILKNPDDYTRITLPYPYKYDAAGPPMCPNDPRTLDREKKLVLKTVQHLKATDGHRTVIMIQLDNEFYYQQWEKERPPDEKSIRCRCHFCDEKWAAGKWKDGEDFMFHSFATYVRSITDAVAGTYDIPVYLNSPWWPPYVVPIFLDNCPHLSLVGIDGIFAVREPNVLTTSQLSRNIPFAAENPTEQPETRLNLDILPYYTLVGQQGIGNLLWECHQPFTVVEDAAARRRYQTALYPLKNAMQPIADARGTDNLVGWYTVRSVAPNLSVDASGNFLPGKADGKIVTAQHIFLREGANSRKVETESFEVTLGVAHLNISGSASGIAVLTKPGEIVLAIPKGKVTITGVAKVTAEDGKYDGATWISAGEVHPAQIGNAFVLDITESKVIRVKF